jgi:hypothetical protein
MFKGGVTRESKLPRVPLCFCYCIFDYIYPNILGLLRLSNKETLWYFGTRNLTAIVLTYKNLCKTKQYLAVLLFEVEFNYGRNL